MKRLTFNYINYKGEVSLHTVSPTFYWYGESEYHEGEQWFLKAYDLDKEGQRDFVIHDIDLTMRELFNSTKGLLVYPNQNSICSYNLDGKLYRK